MCLHSIELVLSFSFPRAISVDSLLYNDAKRFDEWTRVCLFIRQPAQHTYYTLLKAKIFIISVESIMGNGLL